MPQTSLFAVMQTTYLSRSTTTMKLMMQWFTFKKYMKFYLSRMLVIFLYHIINYVVTENCWNWIGHSSSVCYILTLFILEGSELFSQEIRFCTMCGSYGWAEEKPGGPLSIFFTLMYVSRSIISIIKHTFHAKPVDGITSLNRNICNGVLKLGYGKAQGLTLPMQVTVVSLVNSMLLLILLLSVPTIPTLSSHKVLAYYFGERLLFTHKW